ncbi:MAG: NADH:flavin oxidoreductase [Nevskiaceae bacterium]|nr:MAG: NADH:flavin oxidoreductase [Nevskiaceae bacterium]TBR73694.1 MAG: NADH:flavin oxidoreductase [Nevskiaceae bacterium]
MPDRAAYPELQGAVPLSASSPALARALTPWTLGPLQLRNRVIKAATNEGMAIGMRPSQALVEHHRAIARGGAGLTTVAYCAVERDGRTFPDQLVLAPENLAALAVLTAAVHAEGGAVSAQITHGGAFNFLSEMEHGTVWSASGGLNPMGFLQGRLFKKAMTRAAMTQIRDAFVAGARLARQAGFDAVEIHMGHGYLLSQFLSPKYNHRKPPYGGDAAARARFPCEVLAAVRDAVGDTTGVACKLSMFERWSQRGQVDAALTVAQRLQASGAHLLVLSAGMNVEAPWAIFGSRLPPSATRGAGTLLLRAAGWMVQRQQPKIVYEDLYLLPSARQMRAGLSLPLAYLGGVRSVADIETVMREGFDAVVMGRALLHDPDLLRHFREGEVRRSGCTTCNECVGTMYGPAGTHCVLTQQGDVCLRRTPVLPPPDM